MSEDDWQLLDCLYFFFPSAGSSFPVAALLGLAYVGVEHVTQFGIGVVSYVHCSSKYCELGLGCVFV